MNNDPGWTRYWRYLTRAFRSEVREEMDYHLAQRARDLEAGGLSAEAARREALRRFGDPDQVQERLERIERQRGRRITLGFLTDELGQDLRYGFRGLLKRPGFTLTTATSLALGIAAITVVLSLVDSMLLRPLPVRHARELVVIGASNPALGPFTSTIVSLPTYRDVASRSAYFEEASAVTFAVVAARRPEADLGQRRMVLTTSGNYFSVIGLPAFLGRVYTSEDERQRERVIVLSFNTWRAAFAADPAAIGSTLYLNTVPFQVIGVTPEGFTGTDHMLDAYGFVPTSVLGAIDPAMMGIEEKRAANTFKIIARRKPGVSMAAIQADLDVLSGQLTSTWPELENGYRLRAFPESRARPSLEAGSAGTTSAAFLFAALALMVLVTAAVNATNLIIVRGSGRQTELAVRQAMGATRRRVIRQLATETMLIAFLALAGGWALARLAVGTLTSIPLDANGLAMQWGVSIDWRIFLLAVVVTVSVGLVAGIAPAVAVSRFNLQDRLRQGSRGGLGRRGQRIRSALVVLQVAASMVVLIVVGLLGRSAQQAATLDLGFRTDHVVTFGIDATLAHYDKARELAAYDRLEEIMKERPGVTGTAWANSVPLSTGGQVGGMLEVETDVTTQASTTGSMSVFTSAVSPDWFDVVRMPITEGRAFERTDDSLHAPVAIVNERAAATFWPGKPAVGQVIRVRNGRALEVVGVSRDSRYLLITEGPRPFIYLPFAQQSSRYVHLFVRSEQDPSQLVPEIPRLVSGFDKDLVPFAVNTLEGTIDTSVNGMMLPRIAAGMAAAMGALALFLTCLGLYGVVAYSVAQRSREIGLRMALGADRWRVLRSVVGSGGLLAVIGILIGGALAILVARTMSGFLVGVRATDPVVFATVAIALTLVALAAAWLPARRASRIDPVNALKGDGT